MSKDAFLDIAPDLRIPIRNLFGRRITGVGKSGSGKTNTMHVVVEGWLDAGLPLTILDPMRQFRVLKDHYPVVVAGRWKHAHVEISEKNAAALARISYERGLPMVLDLSLYDEPEQDSILLAYLGALWKLIRSREDDELTPYGLFIDEAQLYVPEGARSDLSDLVIDLAKRGRFFQVTSMVATQRPADIRKVFLTGANMLIAHRMMMGTDTKIIGETVSLPQKELNQLVRRMQSGGAIIIADADMVGIDEDYLQVKVRLRRTAPVDGEAAVVEPRGAAPQIDSALLDELKALRTPPEDPDTDEATAALIAELRAEIVRLEGDLDHWRTLAENHADEIAQLKAVTAKVKAGGQRAPAAQMVLAGMEDSQQMTVRERTTTTTVEREVVGTHVSSRSLQILQTRQQKKFENLIRELLSERLQARLVLRFFMGQSGFRSIEDAARALDYDTANSQTQARRLMNLGLLHQKEYRSLYWVARVDEYLTAEFPNLDAEQLRYQLQQVLE